MKKETTYIFSDSSIQHPSTIHSPSNYTQHQYLGALAYIFSIHVFHIYTMQETFYDIKTPGDTSMDKVLS